MGIETKEDLNPPVKREDDGTDRRREMAPMLIHRDPAVMGNHVIMGTAEFMMLVKICMN